MANKELYVVCGGSRDFKLWSEYRTTINKVTDYYTSNDIVRTLFKSLLRNYLHDGTEIHIIHGDARGADSVFDYVAGLYEFKVHKYPANWNKDGRVAGMYRNELMYKTYKDKEHKVSILIWDGKSHGTFNDIYQAYEYDYPLKVYNYVTGKMYSKEEMQILYEDYKENYKRYK